MNVEASCVLPKNADTVKLIVQRLSREADGVVSVLLADAEGDGLPEWEPGAHIDLCLPGMTRQYSLCGDPSDRSCYRLGVLLEPAGRGGSRFIHESLQPGYPVLARPPRNHFSFVDADEYLFIAGGIGITPLLPMIARAEADGRTWQLVYGGRTRSSMAFLKQLVAYGDRVQVVPQDEHGLLDLAELLEVPGDKHVYCCGPEPLLAAVERLCSSWPKGRLHVERFTAPALMGHISEQAAFEVECAESGVTVIVRSEQTMLAALLEAGIDLNFDCKEGTCGTCELGLVDGVAEHRDAVLSQEERDAGELILPCVSRARGARLVVDA
ncbi:oxidoreductase [Pseudonocardia bannensis]|uniref:Oxidoreductase n=1 Tax=Pseudonocardia bannensis TaxID=630973 RepID=A0A848DK38_9PSEU|nr:PDR/VanB family oxidoreductase [Pseudonocardia bannensis]NMH92913.1 oxidoreductase [Pseudonocardia bannensis]